MTRFSSISVLVSVYLKNETPRFDKLKQVNANNSPMLINSKIIGEQRHDLHKI